MAGLTGWFCGNNQHSPWIYSFIPKDIKTYCEPFSGSFPIYFNENFSHVDNIIYNDANKLQVNFMLCAKQHNKLLQEIKKFEKLSSNLILLYFNQILVILLYLLNLLDLMSIISFLISFYKVIEFS